MRSLWDERAWEEYLWWQTQDKKTLKRINLLLKDIGNLSGWWSRRIDSTNKIVYREKDDAIIIAQRKGHYDDK